MRNNPLPTHFCQKFFSTLAVLIAVLAPVCAGAKSAPTQPIVLSGWQLQYAAKTPQSGAEIAAPGFSTAGWYAATVPGTVLTTLVNNRVYPEPLYGENNRPEVIPESLARQSYWYRAQLEIPKSYAGQRVWLNFEGINYSATIWVNGAQVGTMRGAFSRGIFDITAQVTPGKQAAVAALITPAIP
jgi:beta-mannosidase